jgi:hypothetical protein
VVYVIAAYSITISVLAIYGVLLQHRAQTARARVAGRSGGPGVALAQGFNLGAALLAPFWAWFHGLRAVGATLILTGVVLALAFSSGLRWPVMGLTAILAAAAVGLGVVGNRIAAGQLVGVDPDGFYSRELRWALAGAVLFTLVLPWACYFLIGGA